MTGVIANCDYEPRDVIYCEKSFAHVIPRELKDFTCEWCGEKSFILRTCKQCSAVKYCDRLCQKKDWNDHKFECLHMKNLPDTNQTDLVRLLGKIILKLKGKDWKTISRNVLGTEINFDDINTRHEEMTQKPILQLFYKELKHCTEKFIGKENMPSDEDLLKIIGKVRSLGSTGNALGFYIGAFAFDKECIPNANIIPYGRSIKIWAIKDIKRGIDKISIPARDVLMAPTPANANKKPCKCTDCSLPYGESVLTKILDERRAYSVILETNHMLDAVGISPALVSTPPMRKLIDELLKKHEGVLGDTNYLHVCLLAVKCMDANEDPKIIKEPLMKLEEIMSSVYGELYYEMISIYDALSTVHEKLGDIARSTIYTAKAAMIKAHHFI